ncbi:MAG: phenylalanine racemase, partial [Cyanobacteria bacterium QS_4_48_99]
MGLVLAEYLARATNAKLVLVTRSGLPEREEKDAGSRGAGAVKHLEELGSQVLVISADISDRAAMQAAIFQAEAHFGSINGVIHAAGVAGGHTMQLQTQNQAEEVLAAKVRGTLILDELLRDHALDFMILCSSLSAITGGFGQSDYCAANAFLDAFAHYRRATTGQLTISINWDTWQEVGMAVNTAVPELLAQRRQNNIDLGIAPNEGTEAFRRVLDSNFSQVVVSTKALDAVIAQSRASDSLKEKLALL